MCFAEHANFRDIRLGSTWKPAGPKASAHNNQPLRSSQRIGGHGLCLAPDRVFQGCIEDEDLQNLMARFSQPQLRLSSVWAWAGNARTHRQGPRSVQGKIWVILSVRHCHHKTKENSWKPFKVPGPCHASWWAGSGRTLCSRLTHWFLQRISTSHHEVTGKDPVVEKHRQIAIQPCGTLGELHRAIWTSYWVHALSQAQRPERFSIFCSSSALKPGSFLPPTTLTGCRLPLLWQLESFSNCQCKCILFSLMPFAKNGLFPLQILPL